MFDLQSLIKYILEGFAVAIVAYVIPQKTMDVTEIIVLGLVASATFAILDVFSPMVSLGARQGSGFGIGWSLVNGGFPMIGAGYEGFDDSYQDDQPQEDGNNNNDGDDGQQQDNDNNGDDGQDQTGGYDDYPTENFDSSTSSTSSSNDVCTMDHDKCSYKSGPSDEYVCHKDGTNCKSVDACKKDGDKCSWKDDAEKDFKAMSGISGDYQCSMKDGSCKLTKKESFVGSMEDIEGFEGFSKVF